MKNKCWVNNEKEKGPLKKYGYKDLIPVEINLNIKKEIDDYNQKTRAVGKGTYFNLFYFNALIEEKFSKIISRIETQYKANLQSIEMYFTKRQVVKKEYEEMIENLDKQIQVVEKDFEYVKELYNSFNTVSFEENKEGVE